MRRRRRRLGELTSLVDVLFILLFASLVQQRRAEGLAESAEPAPAEETEVAVDAGVEPDVVAADLHQTAREVAAQVDSERVILVAVDRAGAIRSIETDGRALPVVLPLLRETGDDRVVVYAGDQRPELRLCREVADSLGVDRLDRALVLVDTELPLRELGVALVGGLRRDLARCYDDVGATALLVVESEQPPGGAPAGDDQ